MEKDRELRIGGKGTMKIKTVILDKESSNKILNDELSDEEIEKMLAEVLEEEARLSDNSEKRAFIAGVTFGLVTALAAQMLVFLFL